MLTETIAAMRNNCVLRALQHVSGKTDAEIFEAVRRHGYRDHHGMFQHLYHRAADDLGIKLDFETAGWRDYKPQTLGSFLRRVKDGTYFVRVKGHLLVVENGRLVDKNYRHRPALKRHIIDVYKVLNPVARAAGEFIKVIRGNPRRFGTAAWQRYEVMRAYLRGNDNVTKKDLLKGTAHLDYAYRINDYTWDLKRGNIILTKGEANVQDR